MTSPVYYQQLATPPSVEQCFMYLARTGGSIRFEQRPPAGVRATVTAGSHFASFDFKDPAELCDRYFCPAVQAIMLENGPNGEPPKC